MSKLTLEVMRVEHIPQVCEIEQAVFESTWSKTVFERELRCNPSAKYIVVNEGQTVMGYAGVWLVEDEAHVTSLAVALGNRGKGIGGRLLYGLVELCRQGGVLWITLEVRESNRVALRLYRRFGFVKVGKRHNYYKDGEDALVMWAGNIQSAGYRSRLEKLYERFRMDEVELLV